MDDEDVVDIPGPRAVHVDSPMRTADEGEDAGGGPPEVASEDAAPPPPVSRFGTVDDEASLLRQCEAVTEMCGPQLLSCDSPLRDAAVGVSSPVAVVSPSVADYCEEVGSPSAAAASPAPVDSSRTADALEAPAVGSLETPSRDSLEAPVRDVLAAPARESVEASAVDTLAEAPMTDTAEAPMEDTLEAPVTDALEALARDSVQTSSIYTLEEAAVGTLEVLAGDSVEASAVDAIETPVIVAAEAPTTDSLEVPAAEFSVAPVTESLEAPVMYSVQSPVTNDLEVLLTDSMEAQGTDPLKAPATDSPPQAAGSHLSMMQLQADFSLPSADSPHLAASAGGLPVGGSPVAADSESPTSSPATTISPPPIAASSSAMESVAAAAADFRPEPLSSSPTHLPGAGSFQPRGSPPPDGLTLSAASPPQSISPSLADGASHAVGSLTMGQDVSIPNETGSLRAVDVDGLETNVGEYDDFPPVNETDDGGVMMDAQEAEYDEGLVADEHADVSAGKRKRGRPTRAQVRNPSKRKEEEDVCFICFDGGDLVLCDRRGCPKAYHPSCVNRDEAFFRSKGKWNCGWHICSNCEKAAQYMCYTCTFSLCKGCMKNSGFLCVRGNKGLCETCMVTVMHIESNQQESKELAPVDFDDKNNWEYLFKEYWLNLKGKLSITFTELTKAKNSIKGSGVSSRNEESSDELYDANKDPGMSSDSSLGHTEDIKAAKKKAKKRSRAASKDEASPNAVKMVNSEKTSLPEDSEWASKELLEFVAHMRDGDTSVLSPYDVQPLLLEYIKRNKLRDPRKKSQIVCDSRLKNLFGKPRVGHFEMLKLLESHFLLKEEPSQGDEGLGGITDTEAVHMETDGSLDGLSKPSSDKKRKKGKRTDERVSRANVEDYAAIDVHNINLIYLRRNLMEALLDDMNTFESKVVGAFVRIRISGSGQKQDMYRLVQVVGTGKALESYKTGRKTTYITLEILNLNKTEIISIDTISNQEFSEEECKRLRQSIKCGFISRLTVGEIQEKAKDFQAVRVNDWLETEMLRLSHLRDRASEKGRRKELRECVEKLQLLSTPEERARRIQEAPEIHADPNMDPSHESDEDDGDPEDKKQDNHLRPRMSGYGRKGREMISQGLRKSTWEQSGNGTTKGANWEKGDFFTSASDRMNESSWSQGRDASTNSWDPLNNQGVATNLGTGSWNNEHLKSAPPSTGAPALPVVNENDKMWHYQDPSGKIQGPFSITQLRKWSTTGYFPADLRIWRTSERQEDSVLLTDALVGKFSKDRTHWESQRTFQSSGGTFDGRQNLEGWGGTHSLTQVDKPQNVATTEVKGQWSGVSSQGWDLPKAVANNSWTGQPQTHNIRSASSYNGREDIGVDNASRWNPVQNVVTAWNAGGSNNVNSTVQPANGGSREWERPSSIVAPTLRTEGWVLHQGGKNDFSEPPTPTPNPNSSGWNGVQMGSTGMGPTGGSGTQQSAAVVVDSKQMISTWPQQSSNLKSEGVSDSFNPPTPTPKQTSGGWDNLSNPSSTVPQQTPSTVKEPSRTTSNWVQIPPNSDGLGSAQVPRGDQLVQPFSPTMDVRQHSGENLSSQQATVNQVDFSVPHAAAADSRWGTYSSQSSTQVLGSVGPGSFAGPASSAGNNWSAPSTESTAKPSRWGPALSSPHGQNASSTPSNNRSSSLSNQASGGWSAGVSGTANASWGTTPENAHRGLVHSDGNRLNAGGGGTVGQPNLSTGWGQPEGNNANAGNAHWGGHGGPGNANAGWSTATQPTMGWGQGESNNGNLGQGNIGQGNASGSWGPPALQGNKSASWEAASQDNANSGWVSPAGNSNSGSWGNKQTHNGNRYSGHGDQGFRSGDHGHGGNRQSWNRSSGGGWGSSGPQSRGICKYHESGHCRKGANCNYLHT